MINITCWVLFFAILIMGINKFIYREILTFDTIACVICITIGSLMIVLLANMSQDISGLTSCISTGYDKKIILIAEVM